MDYLDEKKKTHLYYLLFSLLFTITFASSYINLVVINHDIDGLLNFPSNTGLVSLKNQHDITMIFSWARRAAENFSIFELGSNLSGIDNHYHHFSSRGLGIYIFGLPTYIFNDSITVENF